MIQLSLNIAVMQDGDLAFSVSCSTQHNSIEGVESIESLQRVVDGMTELVRDLTVEGEVPA